MTRRAAILVEQRRLGLDVDGRASHKLLRALHPLAASTPPSPSR